MVTTGLALIAAVFAAAAWYRAGCILALLAQRQEAAPPGKQEFSPDKILREWLYGGDL